MECRVGGRGGERDLHAGDGGVGRRSSGIGRSIGTTHGVVNEHVDNCDNASTSTSTGSNTV